ncbi:MAG: type II toxin-antitoxin system RelE/ParE family toxin, partial [Chloroflexota bacterium]
MRVRWTEPAADDLTGISDYIEARDSPAAARRVALALYEGIDALPYFPYRGRPGRKPGTRELIYPHVPYLAIYAVRD